MSQILNSNCVGNQTHIRPDIVLAILIEDMCRIVETFSIAFMAKSIAQSVRESQRLNPLQEQWNRSNRRGHGRYTKPPEPLVMTNSKSVLVAPATAINDGLSLPHLSAPLWLNAVICLLLSIGTIRRSLPVFSTDDDPLLIAVASFLRDWIQSRDFTPQRKKLFAESIKRTVRFDLPHDVPANPIGQIEYLLNNVLASFVDHPIRAVKTYLCTKCQSKFRRRVVFDYIPIYSIDAQSSLVNQLATFFSNSNSDLMCKKCSTTMIRSIELEDCKYADFSISISLRVHQI